MPLQGRGRVCVVVWRSRHAPQLADLPIPHVVFLLQLVCALPRVRVGPVPLSPELRVHWLRSMLLKILAPMDSFPRPTYVPTRALDPSACHDKADRTHDGVSSILVLLRLVGGVNANL